MYFWNIESLKEDIRRGEFTDKELMPYIVLTVALYAIGIEFVAYFSYEDSNIWDYLLSILNILIPVGGTLYIYKKNDGAQGSDFAFKYFAIGFVVGIRFLLYLVGVMALLVIYWPFTFGDQEEVPTTFVEVILYSLWYVLLYYKIAQHTEESNTIPATSVEKKPKIANKALKWFGGSIFILFLSIVLYFAVPYYRAPDDLNKDEATEVLNEQLKIYCKKSYSELASLIESEPNYFQIETDSGTNYQIEVQVYTDDNSTDILVCAAIDNGNRSAYHPMVDTFVKKKSEECVRE